MKFQNFHVFKAIYAFGLGSFYFGGNFEQVFNSVQTIVPPPVMLGVKFLIALPLVYHSLTGMRHIFWDTGRGLGLKEVNQTGYLIILLTLIGAVTLATI